MLDGNELRFDTCWLPDLLEIALAGGERLRGPGNLMARHDALAPFITGDRVVHQFTVEQRTRLLELALMDSWNA